MRREARSGSEGRKAGHGCPVAIAACLGKSNRSDAAMSAFSTRCADQNERDCQSFMPAIESGRLEAIQAL